MAEIEKESLKILVDGVFFQLYRTGIARVWKAVLQEWAENGFAQNIVVLERGGSAPKISGIQYKNIPTYDYSKTDADRRILQQVCDEEKADLFISTYYTTPLSTPSVFMAYDMIPEVLGGNLALPMWREKHYGIRHACAFIAISENTARDLAKIFPSISSKSITVAHCGVQSSFSPATVEEVNCFKAKYGISKPYFLLVGAIGGYKNTILFLKAFVKLQNKSDFALVCTGGGTLSENDIKPFLSGINVHRLQLDDEELRTAYSGAIALVYPSQYEGFGLPVLEAIACGSPVITCPNASIPEVAGNAAIYVKDDDVNGMLNALVEVQKPEIRQSLITTGLVQAKKFSWSKMAAEVSSALIGAAASVKNSNQISLQIEQVKQQLQESPVNSSEFLNQLMACVNLYEIDPSDCDVLAELRLIRQRLAQFWLSVEAEKLDSLYSGNVGKAHQALIKSGIKHESLTETEKTFVDELVAHLAQESDDLKVMNYRLAAMLYCDLPND